jgi:dipeptide/tripeptide permease
MALILVGLGFLYLVPGARIALAGTKVGISWLFIVYLIHTLAELMLSPVGLSAMTKLAPTENHEPRDGHLVPRRVDRQFPRGPGRVVL